jgi:hypothetical protein
VLSTSQSTGAQTMMVQVWPTGGRATVQCLPSGTFMLLQLFLPGHLPDVSMRSDEAAELLPAFALDLKPHSIMHDGDELSTLAGYEGC